MLKTPGEAIRHAKPKILFSITHRAAICSQPHNIQRQGMPKFTTMKRRCSEIIRIYTYALNKGFLVSSLFTECH